MKRTLMMTAALIFAGSMSFAAINTDTIATDLQAQGYTRVEIKKGITQIKVEAIRGTEKLEVIYDIETGAILKQEVETVRPGEDTAPGVSVRERNRDFVRVRDNDDDDDDNDDDDNDDDDNDDDDDDNSGHGGGDDDDDDDDNSGHGGGDDDDDGDDGDDDDNDNDDDDDDDSGSDSDSNDD
jgi:hypothetical protein